MTESPRAGSRRTAGAIAEDLRHARKRGGLLPANESDLGATIDLLILAEGRPDDDPLGRARDLLSGHVIRGCEQHRRRNREDKGSQAAASSLRTLLLRTLDDTRKAERIRQHALNHLQHPLSADAVRKREDKIIDEIAAAAFQDLVSRRDDEPRSLEAALHRMVPIASDVRQQLHDGLCLTYFKSPPGDPRERAAIDGFYRQCIVKLGDLVVAGIQLAKVGYKTANMTRDDYWFVAKARSINATIFDQADDAQFMYDFMRQDRSEYWEECLEHLLATAQGPAVFDRWVAWAKSCYPSCAFERAIELSLMCSPHALVTLLYELEVKYLQLGYRDLDIPGNDPILLHHGIGLSGDSSDGT